ncbi:MAG: aldose epimerase family protein [Rikenellaceae bacterium]
MRSFKTLLAMVWGVAALVCCTPNHSSELTLSGIDPARFDTTIMGESVALYTLKNRSGMEVCITNFGARIVSVMVEDRDGEFRDVVLGFDNIGEYVERRMAIGATVGRYAGRIPDGHITIDGKEYQIDVNEPKSNSSLHGGSLGWMNEVYRVESVEPQRITMSYRALDGENGFPADVALLMSYTLTDESAIEISYEATSSAPTVVNMTHHSFFNLSGDSSHPITDHMLRVDSDYTALIDTVVYRPTGELRSVEGTPMDLREEVVISDRIDRYDDNQIRTNEGLDHIWFFNHDRDESRAQAYLHSPESGISLRLYTTQPAVHIYTSNFLDPQIKGRNSRSFVRRGAICFETQHALNVPELHPGKRYEYNCRYEFGVE